LDYGSTTVTTLAGIPKYMLDWLESVLNAAARLTYGRWKYDRITPLHWLSIPEPLNFKWPYSSSAVASDGQNQL